MLQRTRNDDLEHSKYESHDAPSVCQGIQQSHPDSLSCFHHFTQLDQLYKKEILKLLSFHMVQSGVSLGSCQERGVGI